MASWEIRIDSSWGKSTRSRFEICSGLLEFARVYASHTAEAASGPLPCRRCGSSRTTTGSRESRRQFRRSTIMAMPWPPPTHIDSRPMVLSASSRPLSRVHMMRDPVIPKGWPRAMDPPLGLSLS